MRIRRPIATAVAGAVVGTSLGVTAGAASAETQHHRDPRGDVVNVSRSASQPSIDVLSLQNTYRGKRLRVSMTMADRMRRGYSTQWYIATPEATYSFSYLDGRPQPTIVFIPLHPGQGVPSSTCEKVTVKATRDTITGSVPARCIGRADQVRVAGYMNRVGPMSSTYTDDSRQRGLADQSIDYGPALERG